MNQEELINKLTEYCGGEKISCTQARKFAQENGVELARMGEICDEAGIKIYGCELGCF
jgi:IS30 family transposase